MADYQALHFDRKGDVLCVTIDHPSSEPNTIDELLHGELTRVFRELKRESSRPTRWRIGRSRQDTSTALEIVTLQSEDHREALAALREKREPVFRGR